MNLNDIIIIKEESPRVGALAITDKEMKEIDALAALYLSGKMKHSDLIEKLGFDYWDMLLYGNPLEVTHDAIFNLIEKAFVVENEKRIKSYKCFHSEEHGMSHTDIILHRSPMCAWRCLLSKLNHPTNLIIFDMKKLKVDGKENIIQEER
jgi:hypothetical protein